MEGFLQLLGAQDFHVIEDARLDAEKGMFLLEGAIELLNQQQEECAESGQCPVCAKQLESTANCLQQLEMKKESISKTRNDDAVVVHNHCVAALNGAKTRQASSPRLQFYIRFGMLSEWRSQKMESLSQMHCTACLSVFSNAAEFAKFLKRIDSRSSAMERELHVHPKFCPPIKATTATATVVVGGASSKSERQDSALPEDGPTPKRLRGASSTTTTKILKI